MAEDPRTPETWWTASPEFYIPKHPMDTDRVELRCPSCKITIWRRVDLIEGSYACLDCGFVAPHPKPAEECATCENFKRELTDEVLETLPAKTQWRCDDCGRSQVVKE